MFIKQIILGRANSSAGHQLDPSFGPKSPDPFPSSRVGSGDETSLCVIDRLNLNSSKREVHEMTFLMYHR